jgi:hypothetical protein
LTSPSVGEHGLEAQVFQPAVSPTFRSVALTITAQAKPWRGGKPATQRTAAEPQPKQSADILVRSNLHRQESHSVFRSRGPCRRGCGQECPRSITSGKIVAAGNDFGRY